MVFVYMNCLKCISRRAQNDTFQSISNIHKVVSTYIDPIHMHTLYHKYLFTALGVFCLHDHTFTILFYIFNLTIPETLNLDLDW